jgi:glyoxylase I family protein
MEQLLDSLVRSYESGSCTRRQLLTALGAVTGGSHFARLPSFLASAPLKTRDLNHVTLRVKDLDRSKAFYQRLLGLPLIKEDSDVCYLDLGAGFLALWKSPDVGFDHWCVGVEPFDRDAVRRRLEREGFSLMADADDPSTIYVRDPDGLVVQLEAPGYHV